MKFTLQKKCLLIVSRTLISDLFDLCCRFPTWGRSCSQTCSELWMISWNYLQGLYVRTHMSESIAAESVDISLPGPLVKTPENDWVSTCETRQSEWVGTTVRGIKISQDEEEETYTRKTLTKTSSWKDEEIIELLAIRALKEAGSVGYTPKICGTKLRRKICANSKNERSNQTVIYKETKTLSIITTTHIILRYFPKTSSPPESGRSSNIQDDPGLTPSLGVYTCCLWWHITAAPHLLKSHLKRRILLQSQRDFRRLRGRKSLDIRLLRRQRKPLNGWFHRGFQCIRRQRRGGGGEGGRCWGQKRWVQVLLWLKSQNSRLNTELVGIRFWFSCQQWMEQTCVCVCVCVCVYVQHNSTVHGRPFTKFGENVT